MKTKSYFNPVKVNRNFLADMNKCGAVMHELNKAIAGKDADMTEWKKNNKPDYTGCKTPEDVEEVNKKHAEKMRDAMKSHNDTIREWRNKLKACVNRLFTRYSDAPIDSPDLYEFRPLLRGIGILGGSEEENARTAEKVERFIDIVRNAYSVRLVAGGEYGRKFEVKATGEKLAVNPEYLFYSLLFGLMSTGAFTCTGTCIYLKDFSKPEETTAPAPATDSKPEEITA